ncbi:hypothetical protein A3D45_02010 [Candidatus Falkowbacteria bacterium RIFCSPHIGHO2_02_FULL_42_9]|uniref:Uncharacterized protein n=1 Tax=Candidatus Falkowbacteria bacterium RIFCSPHIGHO2_02_FULL_42_9 TaxID=1797986 RepID=A0A1F5S9S3_9BACT|nr:MAG: hypothetical protein A3D45_02010 [Candidatus Falkowbacteria bacterium RIFCSPHIGHO2_02_FULL_42_9]
MKNRLTFVIADFFVYSLKIIIYQAEFKKVESPRGLNSLILINLNTILIKIIKISILLGLNINFY